MTRMHVCAATEDFKGKISLYRIIVLLVFLNITLAAGAYIAGRSLGDPSFFFQERQSVTFLSALQLALSAFSAAIIYSVKRILSHKKFSWSDTNNIWLISFFALGFAMADEYFMIHEGIDGDILTWVFGITDNPHLDGLTLGLYGVAAIALFLKYKKELMVYREAICLFLLCGIFFSVSILLDLGSVDKFRIFLEESAKLMAVSFLFCGFLSILWRVIAGIKKPASLEKKAG